MRFLDHMVQRLYAGLTAGPAINCRPHRSRQRIDLAQLASCCGTTSAAILAGLLGESAKVSLTFDLAMPVPERQAAPSPEYQAALLEYQARQATLRKLVVISDDARTYTQDTGAHALQLGLPVLSLPPRETIGDKTRLDKRVLAPIAFVPCSLTVRAGRAPGVDLECVGDGIDRVIPNAALMSWIAQQTGTKFVQTFAEDEGAAPWLEVTALVAWVRAALGLATTTDVDGVAGFGPTTSWIGVPKAEETTTAAIVSAAVIGLFPLTNQALLEDLEAMAAGEVPLVGPVESFTRVDVEHAAAPRAGATTLSRARTVAGERLVSQADPCQARAVELARSSRALVVHGPPGTGKSQTIANIIGDHLARGERVLFVCDKRTALDVVHHRLEHLGLGSLCAVVHDAARDQKELYRDIRDQLDGLTELRSNERAGADLAARDSELESLHSTLTTHARAVSEPGGEGAASFHSMCGEWIGLPPGDPATESLGPVSWGAMVAAHKHVLEVLTRAADPTVLRSAWRGVVGTSAQEFLAHPPAHWSARTETLAAASAAVDTASAVGILPMVGPVGPRAIGAARARWAADFAAAIAQGPRESLAAWTTADAAARARARAAIEAAAPLLQASTTPLDAELLAVYRSAPWDAAAVARTLVALTAYLRGSQRWYAWLRFGVNAAARLPLGQFGLELSTAAAQRVLGFLDQLRARAAIRGLYEDSLGGRGLGLPEDALVGAVAATRAVIDGLAVLDTDPALVADAAAIRAAMTDPASAAAMLDGLRRSAPRGAAIEDYEATMVGTSMFNDDAIRAAVHAQCLGESMTARISGWIAALPGLEGLLRLEAAANELPLALRPAIWALADAQVTPQLGWDRIRRGVLAGTMAARLRDEPALLAFDGERVTAFHQRWGILDGERRSLTRDAVLLRWNAVARERLLAPNGSRLSSLGAELKRRLALRGERVMRLRQVIAAGTAIEGGDPIFDLRPVWMASPETAAQIFARAPVFDVVVFDEASQCRLEHALPVLLRGKRVVIAGDPKQLPPTRFFESAATTEVEAEEPVGDQAMFETQQAGTEDLLAAALNLEVDQCYLDVHYRSANPDLIGYSNEHFYDRRLQAIPTHPARREAMPPVELTRVDGIYQDNGNPAEATRVVAIVAGLLAESAPPSIGIACFNLVQRDLINAALDDAAEADAEFAERLTAARARRGESSFEGLFVKNLENVQGDERDHIIISTTYGRTPEGKFYRRFGPLGQQGGGRRLNVLITRARKHVHLVTSIPREVYSADIEVPPGQAPGGALLLLGYLRWAEQLARRYLGASGAAAPASRLQSPVSAAGSSLASALGEHLARNTGCEVEVDWGNDGFSIDLAVRPAATGVPVGVLCDGARFDRAVDRVEWDIFRSAMLAKHGWVLLRVSSPQLFRDLSGTITTIRVAAERATTPA